MREDHKSKTDGKETFVIYNCIELQCENNINKITVKFKQIMLQQNKTFDCTDIHIKLKNLFFF